MFMNLISSKTSFRALTLSRSRLAIGNYSGDPLLPKRFHLKDTSLLDDTSVKTRKDSALLIEWRAEQNKLALIKTAYKHGGRNVRIGYNWIFIGTMVCIFAGLYNIVMNALCNMEFAQYSEAAYHDLIHALTDANFNYDKSVNKFIASSLESILTYRIDEHLYNNLKSNEQLFALIRAAVDFK